MSILDKFKTQGASFSAGSIQEYFAIQLARKLKDEANIHFYVQICQNHAPEQVLAAYRRLSVRKPTIEQFRSFFNH